ncbi:MAG: gluconate 2-dehydrogenase subunit 3 family protein, partial [Verrucomicrobia bacterium]|nr:gluconate 2-dehydrogenase subunit 3 family protein [Cytophagales bacterium]
AELNKQKFFTDAEFKTISQLSNIIIPADEKSGSATDAKVPDFIEFIVKDMPWMQTPMRGGLRWLDSQTLKIFGKPFNQCTESQQLTLIDQIAYPDLAKPDMKHGVTFFNLMRNLTASGYFSSEMGWKFIDYKGNTPNNWEGVPPEVLAKYGF